MKRRTVITLFVAAALLVAGIAVSIVAVGMGARPKQLFTDGSYTLDPDSLEVLDEMFDDDRHGFSGSRGDGDFGSRSDVSVDLAGGESNYAVGGDIDSVKIDWISGRVQIVWANVDSITFSESSPEGAAVAGDEALEYYINGKELVIDWRGFDDIIGFDFGTAGEAKNLFVQLPHGLMDISVDTTSADVDLQGFSMDGNLRVSTTSGKITSEDISAASVSFGSTSGDLHYNGDCREFSAETVSGNISFVGSCMEFEADSTSGKVEAEFVTMPNELSAETVSGAVKLALPQDASFVLEYDTVSGGMDCEFPITMRGGEYHVGSGGAEIDVDTVSGNLKILYY